MMFFLKTSANLILYAFESLGPSTVLWCWSDTCFVPQFSAGLRWTASLPSTHSAHTYTNGNYRLVGATPNNSHQAHPQP